MHKGITILPYKQAVILLQYFKEEKAYWRDCSFGTNFDFAEQWKDTTFYANKISVI